MGCFPNSLLSPQCLKLRQSNQTRAIDVVHDDHDPKSESVYGGVKKYSWDYIRKITAEFSVVIGVGGYSTVYLAELGGSIHGAVKVQSASDHLNRLFRQELDTLVRIRHQNIVNLLGYSESNDLEEGALVFEYAPNGSLQDNLHPSRTERTEIMKGRSASAPVLSWRKRMAVAYQLMQAIEFLQEKCTLPIVHGDIKASNILLDEQFNCKLCDFGSAKMGFSSTVTMAKRAIMVGSPGYTDPHYLRTGIASKKSDLYSFGVVVLELVTGMEAFGEASGQLLTSIMTPVLKGNAIDCIAKIVDPRLKGDFDYKEAKEMLSIAAKCLLQAPSLRPSATQVLQLMQDNVPSISFRSSTEKNLLYLM